MKKKLFGTDGIRGTANKYPMTPDMTLKVAMATAAVLQHKTNSEDMTNRVVVGKDTRLSCYMIEQAMAAGFCAMGMEVVLTGPIPTPGIAMLTRSLRADAGIMISASHNPYEDNGIKIFGADGYKLDDSLEQEIENTIGQGAWDKKLAKSTELGKASRLEDASGRYIEYIKRSFTKGKTLSGLKIVIDCANGAAYRIAPQILWELEAEVISLGISPNGKNINDKCGATDTAALQKAVLDNQADIGIALDGDADRLIMVDEKGRRIDGDQLMAALAFSLKARGLLQGNAMVATVMSNLGLERFLDQQNIKLLRSPVGDRSVVELMRQENINLGGEQSGHIILSDYSTTGDGLLAALQILRILIETKKPASEALHMFNPVPQTLKNVRFKADNLNAGMLLNADKVKSALKEAEVTLANQGRLWCVHQGQSR